LFKYCNDGSRKVNDIKKIAPRSDNKYVDMIRVVDGVGQKKAEDILKQFKIYELWDISEKDLRNSVKGIGAKQAENIKKVFHR
jgi:ERCC4-type nuclease